MRPSFSTATTGRRPRSAASPRTWPSTWTGAGHSTGHRRSATAGHPRTVSSPATGRATTRPCWCICWRSAHPAARWMPTPGPRGAPGPAPTSAVGPPFKARPICTLRRCLATSTPTAGSIFAASVMAGCVRSARPAAARPGWTTSRTAAVPRWPSAPTPRPIRWAGRVMAATSGASPPATARPMWCCRTGAKSVAFAAMPGAGRGVWRVMTTARWRPPPRWRRCRLRLRPCCRRCAHCAGSTATPSTAATALSTASTPVLILRRCG